jgi:predicted site-specific integrase-resolvase
VTGTVVTLRQLATRLCVAENTAQLWARTGVIPAESGKVDLADLPWLPADCGPLIDPAGAVRMLGVNISTVRRLAKSGQLANVVLPSGHRRYVLSAVRSRARTLGTR